MSITWLQHYTIVLQNGTTGRTGRACTIHDTLVLLVTTACESTNIISKF